MSLHVPNLDKLIAYLEAQPPERINMGHVEVAKHTSGTCGCIIGHADIAFGVTMWMEDFQRLFGLNDDQYICLVKPIGWQKERDGARRYPAHRVIATLKRLRDRYVAAGEIVVDWGPEPEEGQTWAAPRAIELTSPSLPAEITRLLGAERETVGEI